MYISDEIIKILEYLCDKIGITVDWTSNNVLPYLEQICEKFIRYEIGTSIAWLIIGVICLFFTKWAFKKSKHIKEEIDDVLGMFCYIGTIILLFIGIFIIGAQTFEIIECCTFPEKVIYDYIEMNFSNNR